MALEVRTVTAVAKAEISDSQFFVLYAANDDPIYYVYYDVSGSAADPAPNAAWTGVKVDISGDTTDVEVAVSTAAAIDALDDFSVPVPTTATLTITNAAHGPSTDAFNQDVSTDFIVSTTVQGADLKGEYFDGPTGFNDKMQAVFEAGQSFVETNRAAIASGLTENAAKGLKSFTVRVQTSFEPNNLRLTSGFHAKTYLAGITDALSHENIYSYECVPSVDTDDSTDTFIVFTFTF